MRIRNTKDKKEILESCDFYIDENLFSNSNKICLEIGMGKGDFILNMALNNPNINYIGVEKFESVAAFAIKKIKQYSLSNLKIIICDAKEIPDYLFKKIDTIYLNFSDPWPKKKHHKRRLTHESFLSFYDNLFVNNPHIIMKTDNDDLFEFSKESFLNYGYVINNISYDYLSEIETEYERKFKAKGFNIKFIDVEKK